MRCSLHTQVCALSYKRVNSFCIMLQKNNSCPKKGSIDCSSTSSVVTLDVKSSVFKLFCKSGCVRVFEVEMALP